MSDSSAHEYFSSQNFVPEWLFAEAVIYEAWSEEAFLGTGICFTLWSILANGQPMIVLANLEACKAGREACDPSQLSSSESAELALVLHARNVANCRSGNDACEPARNSARRSSPR